MINKSLFWIYLLPVKNIISITLILLMSMQSFYKLGVITYFQLNREFIAEVLCINKEEPITTCYGQCFLNRNLELADDESQSSAPKGKEKIEFPTFVVSETFYAFHQLSQNGQRNTNYLLSTSSAHLDTPFHPPTVT